MKTSLKYLYPSVLLLLILAACTPAAGSARGFAYIWYVSLTGNNANRCDDPSSPCRTLEGALVRAREAEARVLAEYEGETVTVYHTVNVAAGTYNETALHDGYPFARADINVTVVGGGQTTTVFNSADRYGGIFINGDVRVTLRNFTVQNVRGSAPDSCVNIRGNAEVTIENVTLRRCLKSGIAHTSTGPLILTNVTAVESIDDGFANGVGVSSFGELIIEGGQYSQNDGNGVRSSGSLVMNFVQVQDNGRDGLHLSGSATLSEVNMSGNGQDGSFRAGLFVAGGTISVEHSTILNNQYGIWVRSPATLYLYDSLVANNPRTGIVVSEGEFFLRRSIVENNAAFYSGTSLGGGIDVGTDGSANIVDSQISTNHNGGITNYGELYISQTPITGNDGGQPAIFNGAGATAYIVKSLIANNASPADTSALQPAVRNDGTMDLVNTTISGNDAEGLFTNGPLSVSFVTIASNGRHGLLISESATSAPTIANLLVAGNGTDCYIPGPSGPGPASLSGHNIDTDGSCDFSETVPLASLMLEALGDNGGPTLTHALMPGSPAINAASGSCPVEDQRLTARPFGPACDVGAYESDSATALSADFTTPTPGPITAIITTDARCRTGPGFVYADYDFFTPNQTTVVYARIADSSWYQVQAPTLSGKCWIGQAVLEFDVTPEVLLTLPVLQPPPTPTPTPGDGGGQAGSAPDAPSGLKANETVCNANDGYKVKLTWNDNSDNEAGFRVYHNGQLVATLAADVEQYTHTVPGNFGQQQSYFVEAYNNSGSAKSNTATEDGCLY